MNNTNTNEWIIEYVFVVEKNNYIYKNTNEYLKNKLKKTNFERQYRKT